MSIITSILSSKLRNLKPSATLAISSKAEELKKQGKNIISLATGEPEMEPPSHVTSAAIAALKQGFTKYTAVDGITELKEAIKNKFLRDNNLSYELNEIIVSSGAKQAIYNAFVATLNDGEEVLIPAPYWVSYPEMVTLCGGVPKILSPRKDFKIDFEELEALITDNTKWLCLNYPSNPCGVIYNESELKKLGEILAKYPHIYILSDEIYEKIVLSDIKFKSFADVNPHLKNRVVTINGVSKSYAMTGFRIGYAAGPKEIIGAMKKIQSQTTSNPCSISQYAALAALNGDQSFTQTSNVSYKRKMLSAIKILSQIEGVEVAEAEGSFYLFPSCEKLIPKKFASSVEFASYILEEAEVAIVPGSAFGMDNNFRISFACPEADLIEACERIARALAKL